MTARPRIRRPQRIKPILISAAHIALVVIAAGSRSFAAERADATSSTSGSGCVDDPAFFDHDGFSCDWWRPTTCGVGASTTGGAQAQAQIDEVRTRCPRACGVCTDDVVSESREAGDSRRDGNLPECRDNTQFFCSATQRKCNSFSPVDCARLEDFALTGVEARAVRENCPRSCGYCGASNVAMASLAGGPVSKDSHSRIPMKLTDCDYWTPLLCQYATALFPLAAHEVEQIAAACPGQCAPQASTVAPAAASQPLDAAARAGEDTRIWADVWRETQRAVALQRSSHAGRGPSAAQVRTRAQAAKDRMFATAPEPGSVDEREFLFLINNWTMCEDSLTFRDALGNSCTDWAEDVSYGGRAGLGPGCSRFAPPGQSISGRSLTFGELKEVHLMCRRTCGLCGADVT